MIQTSDFTIYNADCIPVLQEMERDSVDLAVFSPPFSSLYAYTDADADMGNSRESDDEFLPRAGICSGRQVMPRIGRQYSVRSGRPPVRDCLRLLTTSMNTRRPSYGATGMQRRKPSKMRCGMTT